MPNLPKHETWTVRTIEIHINHIVRETNLPLVLHGVALEIHTWRNSGPPTYRSYLMNMCIAL